MSLGYLPINSVAGAITTFNLGSILSLDGKKSQINLPKITKRNIQILEAEIDKMEEKLAQLKDFQIVQLRD